MHVLLSRFSAYTRQPVHIAPLALFRILFGGVMLASILRFILKGWVAELYINPVYHFTYYGFGWVKPLGEWGMYGLFALLAITALCIMLGLFYKVSITLFFLAFTYVELIDKATYLNHYYFVSIISFLLILVPAHRYFSLDVWRNSSLLATHVPRWTVGIFQWQLGLVYFYAGLAKLNYDWFFQAMPLRIWLPSKSDMPVIGNLFDQVWVAYAFSWFGALYDLTIFIFLSIKRTRLLAYIAVVAFHISTAMLFQIGMFPYIMMLATLIYFPENFHKSILASIRQAASFVLRIPSAVPTPVFYTPAYNWRKPILAILAIHFAIQLIFPWRFALYPGKLFWTEQGYRFSWRVMLMEKAGMATFYVKDPQTGREWEVMNNKFLTPNQEKMMATQPDMILQFAHYLQQHYTGQGIANPVIRAESYVTLNGNGSRPFIDNQVNLALQKESFLPKTWILPLKE
jgi:hypothetical protein